MLIVRSDAIPQLPDHSREPGHGLADGGVDLVGGQDEPETTGVGKLDGERVLDASRALRPVVASA